MRTLAIVAVVACLHDCREPAGTPPGTTIGQVDRLDLPGVGADSSAWKTYDQAYKFTGPALYGAASPSFRVTFEYASATYVKKKDGDPSTVPTLRKLRISVAKNDVWTMSTNCRSGELSSGRGTLAALVACDVTIARKNGAIKFTSFVEIYASGSVYPSRDREWDVIPA